jgi:hypothetical protein
MNGHALPIISKDTCDRYFTNGIYALTVGKFKTPMITSLRVTHENISRYLFAHAFGCNTVGFLLISGYFETGPQGKSER